MSDGNTSPLSLLTFSIDRRCRMYGAHYTLPTAKYERLGDIDTH